MNKATIGTPQSQPKRMTAEERKAQLVEVTRRLIESRGISGATTARIAEAAGVTEPTLYRHFGSRKGLLLEVLSAVYEDAALLIEAAHHPNALERLREIGRNHNRALVSQERGFTDPLYEFVSAPAIMGFREAIQERATDKIVLRLVANSDESRATGTIRSDVDSTEMAWQMVMFFWTEDVAYLGGFKDQVLRSLSLKTLNVLLREMEPDRPGETPTS